MASGRGDRARRAMILAAGYGTRLAPVTDHVPKPLLPVGGVALLDRIVAALDDAGAGPIAVNTHHLPAAIAGHLAARPDADRFALFFEPGILGTGGALDNARSFLELSETFLLHNGDVLCDADLAGLWRAHEQAGCLATLLLVDWPAVNSVDAAPDGRIVRIAGRPAVPAAGTRAWTFSGVGVYSRRLLERIGPGFSSLIDPLVAALAEDPRSVRGWVPESVRWSDLGTLPRWLEAQPEPAAGPAASTVPGAELRLERIAGHGSPRRFWRLATEGWSAVAMQSPPEDVEYERQVAIGRWLADAGLAPPALLSRHDAEKTLLLEDLGPRRLYEIASGSADEARRVSEAALDWALRLQSLGARAAVDCPSAVDRVLDPAMLRWETDYFRERFLAGHCELDPGALAGLDEEFAPLAACVARQPLAPMHRDFQSQNLHWQGGRIRPVDFQGLRLGPLGYDAASLIFDPYVDLGEGARDRLLEHFAAAAAAVHGRPADEIGAMVLAAALQRLMQALGAYGFLGHVRGRAEFLAHIPSGLARLREVFARIAREPAGPWLPGPLPRLEGILAALEP